MQEYDQIASHYDAIQGQLVDYKAEVGEIHRILSVRGAHRVVDLACGTGSHLVELAKLGYRCVGVDSSSEMIRVAREKARSLDLEIDFVMGDMREFRPTQEFDAAIVLYALTSLAVEAEWRSALDTARKAIHDGGLFYFNVLNANSQSLRPVGESTCRLYLDVVVDSPSVRLVRLNQTMFRGDVQEWTALYLIDGGDGVRTVLAKHDLRFFQLAYVEQELDRVGFRLGKVTYSGTAEAEDLDIFVLAETTEALPRG